MEAVKKHKTVDEAYLYLSALCVGCEYCISDMRRKMHAWTMPEGSEEDVITRLLKDNFVNESRYASAFVRDKFRHNKWGWQKIQFELRRKGISDEDIENARQEISDEEVAETLRKLLESKRRTIKGRNDYDIKAKLFRFALSRGFSYDQIEDVIDIDD